MARARARVARAGGEPTWSRTYNGVHKYHMPGARGGKIDGRNRNDVLAERVAAERAAVADDAGVARVEEAAAAAAKAAGGSCLAGQNSVYALLGFGAKGARRGAVAEVRAAACAPIRARRATCACAPPVVAGRGRRRRRPVGRRAWGAAAAGVHARARAACTLRHAR
jgi:hypothetical protein